MKQQAQPYESKVAKQIPQQPTRSSAAQSRTHSSTSVRSASTCPGADAARNRAARFTGGPK